MTAFQIIAMASLTIAALSAGIGSETDRSGLWVASMAVILFSAGMLIGSVAS